MTPPNDIGIADEVFYNVPPAEGAKRSVVSTDAAGNPSSGIVDSLKAHLPKRNVLIVLGVVVLLIAGLLGFLILRKKSPTPPSDAETTSDEQTQPETTQPDNTASQQPAGVTTPGDWQKQYFGSEVCQSVETCGDNADPDRDGLNNGEEHTLNTDPNNPDGDGDGLADGDEAHAFGGSPLKASTAGVDKYTDADNARGAYDPQTNKKYSDDMMIQVKAKIKQYGLHQPTIGTLGESALIKYDFVETTSNGTTPSVNLPQSLDRSPQAVLDRDTQRLATVRKIGTALIKYKDAQHTLPQASDFLDLVSKINNFLTVATNPVDPINISPFVYTYQVSQSGQDFTITYYSESQNQLVKFTEPDARKSATKEETNLNDDQRIRDLETLKSALLIYSEAHRPVNASVEFVFPTAENYKTELSPNYLSNIPKDPKTKKDYEYQVSPQFDSFTLKAPLENAPTGSTGYLCDQEECRNY